jgi:peptidoglycan/LPS O-acetylase OafA/YrhL
MVVCPPEQSVLLNSVTTVLARGGWIGVDLFFVLSGFLISGLLFREYQKTGAVNVKRFFIRRGFKIYPSFWLMLIVTVVVFWSTAQPIRLQPTLGEVLFLQNYIGSYWSHTWSLAVEEHFYIFLAALLWLLVRIFGKNGDAFRYVPAIFVLVAITALVLRVATLAYVVPFDFGKHVFPTHLRIDSLFFGVVIGYYWHFGRLDQAAASKWRRIGLTIAGVCLLAPAFIVDVSSASWMPHIGFTMLYIGSGCLLLAAINTPMGDSRILRALAHIGSYSYCIYLWHLPLQVWLRPALAEWSWFVYAAVYIPLAVAAGIVTSRAVEYPTLRIRDRLFPGKAVALEPAHAAQADLQP